MNERIDEPIFVISVAAKMIGAESCNGWTYWHYQSGNNFKPIDELREKLRPAF